MSDGNNTPNIIKLAERINRLNQQRAETEEAIKEVYLEARSHGYEPKILKKAISLTAMKPEDIRRIKAEQEVLDLYLRQMDFNF
jgi:uncharacterized protein (UPF0335 family)